jgi:hypothetical protein
MNLRDAFLKAFRRQQQRRNRKRIRCCNPEPAQQRINAKENCRSGNKRKKIPTRKRIEPNFESTRHEESVAAGRTACRHTRSQKSTADRVSHPSPNPPQASSKPPRAYRDRQSFATTQRVAPQPRSAGSPQTQSATQEPTAQAAERYPAIPNVVR